MNRHKKFYNDLEDNLEDDYYDEDEYYDDEEADYYEEDELQYVVTNGAVPQQQQEKQSTQAASNGVSSASVGKTKTTSEHLAEDNGVHPEDMDYALVVMLLPEFQHKWKELVTAENPGAELLPRCAVDALRECNYDVGEAVMFALRKSIEAQPVAGTPAPPPALSPQPSNSNETAAAAPVAGGRTLKLGQSNKASENVSTKDGEAPKPVTSNGAEADAKLQRKKNNTVRELMPDPSKKDCTVVIAGHVDAGKSTTLGHLLLLLGKVSQADIDKNERNARQMKKESFKYAWLLDQSEEERRRGVTIDAGSYCFETDQRRIHVLDAPGHKDYVLSMISSATQADAALLVVTAATSEFEVGLAHGTKDHLLVLKTLGVGHLVVAVNKMDAVDFSQERYDFVVRELKFLLKQTRYKDDAVVGYCPVSGMRGTNISTIDHEATPWYDGPSLVQLLDKCPLESRLLDAPLRLSLQDVDGTKLYCKVESGHVRKADKVVFVPSDTKVVVKSIDKPTVGALVDVAFAGDTVEIETSSSLVGLRPGCIGCSSNALLRCSTDFQARVQTFNTLQKSILPGTVFTMVVHALTLQVQVIALVSKMDKQGAWSKGMVKCIPKATQALIVFRAPYKIALEEAEVCRALGRFVLQQDGDTVAGGLVERVML
ncbi:elongation factor 1-alpha (EF-1-alpha) [Trypanosoma grayi]|uniref:elongation factor 1-alpha (EF-1-alpha) n=1 Tax=Trypanosoma grayi TaxID=71804 RepID=UPI0004F4833A|nr:elongation factor 1-alpha (EF-1-alpha) [Trypanosoma grayi]KEG11369.1 elongation factor 1-alpha (EF-1-alpha) [Trypanosoma grayi]